MRAQRFTGPERHARLRTGHVFTYKGIFLPISTANEFLTVKRVHLNIVDEADSVGTDDEKEAREALGGSFFG
jgi:ethanolamine utilization cobalamin adenosyltransferase